MTSEDTQRPLRISPEGEMTIYQAMALKETLLSALRQAESIDLDLSAISEIDSAGLQLLLLTKRESLLRGKTLRIVAHSAATLDLIDTCNLAAYFGDPVLISD